MKLLIGTASLALLLGSLAFGASGGGISGTVKDPGGAPLMGAFVRARNGKTKITMNVLSDKQGRYRMQDLPPGTYEVRATAVGFKEDLRPGLNVAEGESASLDFALQKGLVRWSDLSVYQGRKLLPEGKGKTELFGVCFACHGFETRMAATRRDEAGWVRAVGFMRESMSFFIKGRFTDQNASDVTAYLNNTFGVDSELPRSPADLPGYRETVRPLSEEAMKIVYVDYELPGPNRFPWSGAQDKDGNIWIPYYGRANHIGRLNPSTGEVQEFPVPNQTTAAIHSAVPAPDGSVWLAQQGSNKIGRWDPGTQKITEFQDAITPGKEGTLEGGSKHTVRIDSKGNVWGTGSPFSRFDPKTGKFHDFPEIPTAYGVVIDKDDNAWFAEFAPDGKIGKVDGKTLKVTKYTPPTAKCWPRRIQIDPDGIIWFAEFRAGKIGRFDPKTETFKEYVLPGPEPTPYALGIDKNNRIWYSSEDMDVVGRLDPKTGQITEYPIPYSENTMREFFFDTQGRMWFASPTNNKVGYIIFPNGS